jgi:hypothetical protein
MYSAIVAPITVRKHPNADKLQLGTVAGHQVVVGLDVHDGDLGVFFPTDGQLSHEMCVANTLYNESACGELGVTAPVVAGFAKYGFFSAKRRVRAQKFRGEKSDGYWTELQALAWTGYDLSLLKAGDTFTELDGKLVCNKFYNPATLRAMANAQKHGKKQPNVVFPKHVDTEQFRYFVGNIPSGSIIWFTEKVHGTSGRYGHVYETYEPHWWTRTVRTLCNRLVGDRVKPKFTRWTHLNGSRNVLLEQSVGEGFYGTNDFRYRMTENLQLHKGEIVYFEIVGFVDSERQIMEPQPIDPKQLKDVAKQFGDRMEYTYGCVPGECKKYVYRITRLNEDGVEVELGWPQVIQRCRELGLETVPQLAPPQFYYGDTEKLVTLVNSLTDGVSTLDARHIREGVVLRVDTPDGVTKFYKNKAWVFGVLEGYIKDSDTVVDTEEAA